jgi:hypothetical protein
MLRSYVSFLSVLRNLRFISGRFRLPGELGQDWQLQRQGNDDALEDFSDRALVIREPGERPDDASQVSADLGDLVLPRFELRHRPTRRRRR